VVSITAKNLYWPVFANDAHSYDGRAKFMVREGDIHIEADVEAAEILLVLVPDTVDQALGGDAFPLGTEHNSSTMSIVRTNVVAVLATHFLIAHPDIRLNVFQQMAQVDGAIGVRQGAGNQNIALLL